VLARMRQAGFNQRFRSQTEAEATPLRLQRPCPSTGTVEAPTCTSWVAQELPNVVKLPEQLEVGGLTIRAASTWPCRRGPEVNQAAVGQRLHGGALVTVRAGQPDLVVPWWAVRITSKRPVSNRATQALTESPGSTSSVRLFAASRRGMRPETVWTTRRRCFAGYCPKNFGDRYRGKVAMATALQSFSTWVAVTCCSSGLRQGDRQL